LPLSETLTAGGPLFLPSTHSGVHRIAVLKLVSASRAALRHYRLRQAEQRSDEEKATQRWGKVYHLQYLPLPQGIWRRSVFFLHVVATDQAQWCTPVARMSRPVMRCAIADCGRQIMVSSAIAALHMRSSFMVLKSRGKATGLVAHAAGIDTPSGQVAERLS
jgi:hypothetical protein